MAMPMEGEQPNLRSQIAMNVAKNRGQVAKDVATLSGVKPSEINDTNIQAIQQAAETGSDEGLTNKQKLIAQALIAFVPALVGAAVGGAEGGAAGAGAGMQGLQAFGASEEAQKKEKKEAFSQKLQASKEGREQQKLVQAEERDKERLGIEKQKLKIEQAKASGEKPGKHLTSEQSERLAGIQSAYKTVADLRSAVAQNKEAFGPVAGRLGSANPYSKQGQSLRSLFGISAQTIAKGLEGGKLTDQDRLFYEKMLPNPVDTPEVASAKLDALERYIANKEQSEVETLGRSGFAVTRFQPRHVAAPSIAGGARPEGVGMGSPGTPSVNAAPAPVKPDFSKMSEAELDKYLTGR